jgi:hypothetical protein
VFACCSELCDYDIVIILASNFGFTYAIFLASRFRLIQGLVAVEEVNVLVDQLSELFRNQPLSNALTGELRILLKDSFESFFLGCVDELIAVIIACSSNDFKSIVAGHVLNCLNSSPLNEARTRLILLKKFLRLQVLQAAKS